MKSLRTLLALVLALALVVGCFFLPELWVRRAEPQLLAQGQENGHFGLTETEETEASQDTPVGTGAEVEEQQPWVALPLTEDPATFQVWAAVPQPQEELLALAEAGSLLEVLAQETGVTLEYSYAALGTHREQFNLMMAAGSYPEVLCNAAQLYAGGTLGLLEDQVCLDLLPLLGENAPNYAAAIGEDAQVYAAATTADGRMGALYALYDQPWQEDSFYVIRQDLLDAVGMTVPTTADALDNLLLALQATEQGHGQLVLTLQSLPDCLLSGFDTAGGLFLLGDTVQYGPAQPGYLEFLSWAWELAALGCLQVEPDLAVDQADLLQSYVAGDCVPTDREGALWLAQQSGLTPAVLGPLSVDGTTAYYGGTAPSVLSSFSWSITTGCQDPALLLQMVDYLFTQEGALLCNYGLEGETFQYDDSGTPQLTLQDLPTAPQDLYTAWAFYGLSLVPTRRVADRGLPQYLSGLWSRSGGETDGVSLPELNNDRCLPAWVQLPRDDQQQVSQLLSDLQTYCLETTQTFLEIALEETGMGEITTGETAQNALQTTVQATLQTLSLDTVLSSYQAAYDQSK
jgi:putative aldouronate transport system substrate-binding protein